MSKLKEELAPTVAAFKELGPQFIVIDKQKLDDDCHELESRWREIQMFLPQRISVVRKEIDSWVQFDDKLEEFQSWLEEVKEMCGEWKMQGNSNILIQNLEVSHDM